MFIGLHVTYHLLMSNINEIWIFLTVFFSKKNFQISNLMKIRPMITELIHADGRMDGRTWRSQQSLFENLRKRLKKWSMMDKFQHQVVLPGLRKALPLQAWAGTNVEAPRFQDIWHMKVVRLSALSTGRLYSFLLEDESTPGPKKFQWQLRKSNPRPSKLLRSAWTNCAIACRA
jgi:hypothetical protein